MEQEEKQGAGSEEKLTREQKKQKGIRVLALILCILAGVGLGLLLSRN